MSVSQIINVVVNSKGAVTVTKQLNAMGDSARDTTNYLNTLRAILTSVLTFSGARAIVEAADNFTNLQNKLKIVATETENLSDNWNRLMDIARNSYSTIDTTVDLYFRVAQAYQAWGESAEKAYQFTNSFQKAAILSGSSMQTTAQAVYQFGQALNKGKLDGDEFRSVMEGLPYVSNILQKSLGVTRAELYKLSAEGKISLNSIKEAFEGAAKKIDSDFKNITPTIGMAMNILRNSWTDFIGDIQTSTGVFSLIARLILVVSDNFGLLAAALAPVALSITFLAGRAGLGLVVLGLTDLAKALNLAAAAQWLLNAAMNANPIVLAVTAVAGLVVGIIYFREQLGLTNEMLLAVWNVLVSAFTDFLTYILPVTAIVNALVTTFSSWEDVLNSIGGSVTRVGQFFVSAFNSIKSVVVSAVKYMVTAFGPVFSDLMELGRAYFDLVSELAKLFMSVLSPAISAILDVYKKVWSYMEPALRENLKLLQDIIDGWKIIGKWLNENFAPIIKDVFDGWIVILRTVVEWVTRIINALKEAIAMMNRLSGGRGGGAPSGAFYGAQFYAGEFASGGRFNVGGTGSGRDNTPVAFRAQRGERVTVETKRQQRDNDNSQAPTVNVPLQITNVLDTKTLIEANNTRDGQRSIINVIKLNREEIRSMLGAG